jgi:ribosomal-protein-alanine N-acetyltransferase
MPKSAPDLFRCADPRALSAAGAADPRPRFCELSVDRLGRLLEIERQAFSNPWGAVDFRRIFLDASVLHLGMEVEGRLIGYAIGYLDGAFFHLANLAVDSCNRRRGWGEKLLREILAQACERGCRTCSLEVRESNVAAIQLYRRSGFQQVAVRAGYYCKPRENALVLHRAIENF